MKNKDILIIILINIILLILLCLITTNRYITILIEIILYLVYYIYLLFKKDYISYKVIVSNLIMCLIGILVIYIVNGKIDFVIDEDLSNIEESFSIYSLNLETASLAQFIDTSILSQIRWIVRTWNPFDCFSIVVRGHVWHS